MWTSLSSSLFQCQSVRISEKDFEPGNGIGHRGQFRFKGSSSCLFFLHYPSLLPNNLTYITEKGQNVNNLELILKMLLAWLSAASAFDRQHFQTIKKIKEEDEHQKHPSTPLSTAKYQLVILGCLFGNCSPGLPADMCRAEDNASRDQDIFSVSQFIM